MSRLIGNEQLFEAVTILSEGSVGAVSVLVEIIKTNERIDPDDVFGSVGPLFTLDSLGIYGSKIWMLHKEVCKQKIILTLAMIRAAQMGIISAQSLKWAIDHAGQGIDPIATMVALQRQLPRFNNCQAYDDPAVAPSTLDSRFPILNQ